MEYTRLTTDFRIGGLEVPRLQALAVVQFAWMLIALLGLLVVGAFTVENYYVLSYFGLVVSVLLLAPVDRETGWSGVTWLLRAGFLGLCYFVARRAMALFGL